jgi:hypothetical protein
VNTLRPRRTLDAAAACVYAAMVGRAPRAPPGMHRGHSVPERNGNRLWQLLLMLQQQQQQQQPLSRRLRSRYTLTAIATLPMNLSITRSVDEWLAAAPCLEVLRPVPLFETMPVRTFPISFFGWSTCSK